MVASTMLCPMRTHRLLRQFAESTRIEALSCDRPPGRGEFEPGETWFYDFRMRKMFEGQKLAEPRWHPESQTRTGLLERCHQTGSCACIKTISRFP